MTQQSNYKFIISLHQKLKPENFIGEIKMKKLVLFNVRLLFSVSLALFTIFGCNQPPENKQEAQVRIDKLMNSYSHHFNRQNYSECINDLNEILSLCEKFTCDTPFMMDIYDRKHFTLMSAKKFSESLVVATTLEELSRKTAEKEKPWYFLKIADSYLGMGDYSKAIEWIGRAVSEKGFNNYKIFQKPKYQQLQTDSTFQSLVVIMKGRIGIDEPARDFTVYLTDGKPFSLSIHKGKVVLIDFWDVRCAPCIKALPELKELYSQYHQKGLEIIGISLDSDKELLSNFLNKNEISWPIACSYKGWKDDLVSIYGISATPSTWLIDRNGILRYNELSGNELKVAIESLLKVN